MNRFSELISYCLHFVVVKIKCKVTAMINKLLMTVIFLFTISVAGLSAIHAFDRGNSITPYGDFCKHVSHYGMHKSVISMKHAKEALLHYYGNKGLHVEIESKQGRFLKAKIHNGKQTVDIKIFDRHSGRVRSIY
jgi:hypothetical protein